MEKRPGTALVIVGHGSTTNPDSSEPNHLLADAIRARGIFDEVLCCFWKEEPSMREILHSVSSSHVYVVPNFISEGYFTQTVIPRELGLDGPVTLLDGKTIRYCEPVGNHASMTSVLLKRARETAAGIPTGESSLLIVGHGTNLNDNSAKAAKTQVALLTELGLYAEVLPTYMEEAPLISDWSTMTTQQNVVVIPFFISDGLHSYQDIPVLLGIREEVGPAASQSEVFKSNPHHLQGKNLFYGSAIGTDPMMAEVILDQVKAFDAACHPIIDQIVA
ncbi:MAG: cobalamin biosynthesis protein CbiX [Verrucomicrobia bacterium]|jgi:sirohydrochlorin cobaltochelatase|nr:cobalamin biosynthesis protein CbiX [Verrucomicrobiota bacterium]